MKPQAFFMHKIFAYEGIISSSNSSFELTNGHEFELLPRKKHGKTLLKHFLAASRAFCWKKDSREISFKFNLILILFSTIWYMNFNPLLYMYRRQYSDLIHAIYYINLMQRSLWVYREKICPSWLLWIIRIALSSKHGTANFIGQRR